MKKKPPKQSELFIEKANEERCAADKLMERLAKTPPAPRK
jgi:hypothetical protein